jgi:hypothetical protein
MTGRNSFTVRSCSILGASVLATLLFMASLPAFGQAGILDDSVSPPTRVGNAPVSPVLSSITTNFNGTPVDHGFIWFNAVIKVSGTVGPDPVTLAITGSSITFVANGTQYALPAPDGLVTISPAARKATTEFDETNHRWMTTVPSGLGGRIFLTGMAFPVSSAGLPGGINPVTWRGSFSSTGSGLSVEWRWSAAAYADFTDNYNALGVKPVDDNRASAYRSMDPAGTPETFKGLVVSGATGAGWPSFVGTRTRGHIIWIPICNIWSDPNNCGACGNVCPTPPNGIPICSGGICGVQCNPGYGNCDGVNVNGCESVLNTTWNCGVCGNVCPGGFVCMSGTCVGIICPPGQLLCNGICSDTSSDPNNCGDCGHVCPEGQLCVSGACQPPCGAGQTVCNGVCTVLGNDPNNCGACGNVCPGGQPCVNGACEPCPSGTILCGNACVNPNTNPENCGGCGIICPTGELCESGTCVTPGVAASCLPASAMSVLIQGTGASATVKAYVPYGSWSEPNTDIRLVPIEGAGSLVTIPTTKVVNSCASNSVTGVTVCTANTPDVYIITGSTIINTLTSGNDGTTQWFSGGGCQDCGVALNAATNKAIISMGYGGSNAAFQALNLSTNTFSAPYVVGTVTSENMSVDPVRNWVLSPNETGIYQILKMSPTASLHNNAVTPNSPPFFESAAEDCSTGIALATSEFTGDIYISDLTQSTFVPGAPGTWTAASQVQNFPEFVPLTAGTCGIGVVPGTHLGVVTGEFGGYKVGAIRLPSTSGVGIPAVQDWVIADIPNNPAGGYFDIGKDPHTVTVYKSPINGKAYALIADDTRTYIARIDLAALLAALRTGLHTVDPSVNLISSGILNFIPM